MEAYSSYNQIKMDKGNVSHIKFYVDSDIYHYIVMHFALINIGVTYQRIVNKFFTKLIGKMMDALMICW